MNHQNKKKSLLNNTAGFGPMGIILFFLLFTQILNAQDLRIYRMHPSDPYPGTPVTLYGSGFDKDGVFLIIDGSHITRTSPDVILWEDNKISLFLPNSNGKGTVVISDGKTKDTRYFTARKSGRVEYFNPVTYTLEFTITVKAIKRLNREKGTLLLYVPQPLLSDELTAKEIVEINPKPDYVQDNGILIYEINPDITGSITIVEKLKVTTWYKKYHFDSFTEQLDLDKKSNMYAYYTRQEKPYIIPYDPVIIKLRNSLVSGKDTSLQKTAKIYSWVAGKMEHEYPPENRSPLFSIEHGKGDCLSDAYLFASLIRSAGIPIRFNAGYIFYHNWEIGGQHFWEEVLIPGAGWITFDASFGHSAEFLHQNEYPSKPPFYSGGVDGRRMAFSKGITALYKPDEKDELVFFKTVDHMQVPRLFYSNPASRMSYHLDKKMKVLEIKEEYAESEDWFKKETAESAE